MTDIVSQDLRFCPKCQTPKPKSDFRKDSGKRDGLYLWCKVCHSTNTSKRAKEIYDASKQRVKMLKTNYGISEKEYAEMFLAQGGVCASCGRKETKFSNKANAVMHLSVDHCHKTGKVRALLCHACNSALGTLNEDPSLIESLRIYALRIRDTEL